MGFTLPSAAWIGWILILCSMVIRISAILRVARLRITTSNTYTIYIMKCRLYLAWRPVPVCFSSIAVGWSHIRTVPIQAVSSDFCIIVYVTRCLRVPPNRTNWIDLSIHHPSFTNITHAIENNVRFQRKTVAHSSGSASGDTISCRRYFEDPRQVVGCCSGIRNFIVLPRIPERIRNNRFNTPHRCEQTTRSILTLSNHSTCYQIHINKAMTSITSVGRIRAYSLLVANP